MNRQFIYTSLTRIAHLQYKPFEIQKLPAANWENGDFVVFEITHTDNGDARIELTDGRMMDPLPGLQLVGALGVRHATLEITGSYTIAKPDQDLHLLTGAGLIGKMTSRSHFAPYPITGRYKGHLFQKDEKLTMQKSVVQYPEQFFHLPVVLFVGTSMSAGKTTAARVAIQLLKKAGLKTLGAKITGAGRYRDILAMKDAGADFIFDFVDVGLPSSIGDRDLYLSALQNLLSRMANIPVDVAVIEIGASPLEVYNGDLAFEKIKENIRCNVLCASDPYAVYGVMKSYDMVPDFVSGPATNTLAGVELIQKLCKVDAANLLDKANFNKFEKLLWEKLEIQQLLEIKAKTNILN